MLELHFQIEGCEPERITAEPVLTFKLRVEQKAAAPLPIQTALLRCQIRIEPARRRYDEAEKKRLLDLFGTPERWGQTVRPLPWTQTTLVLRAFTEATVADLPVPCGHD